MSEERLSLIDTGPFLTIMSKEPPQNVEFYDNQDVIRTHSNPGPHYDMVKRGHACNNTGYRIPQSRPESVVP